MLPGLIFAIDPNLKIGWNRCGERDLAAGRLPRRRNDSLARFARWGHN